MIDVEEKLRHLPWELLNRYGNFLCANEDQVFTPVRYVSSGREAIVVERKNRPLRVLFMACSPEKVEPVLNFENEEAMILNACLSRKIDIELVVEESGCLCGVQEQIQYREPGFFDIFHLTGHAGIDNDTPIFLMENDFGGEHGVTANELKRALGNKWPRLIFLSGCETGHATNNGALPSLCEALVKAGAPAVLGWEQPVFDKDASFAAAELYGHLSTGVRIDEAVARTRQALLENKYPGWHLLQLYANNTPLIECVTPPRYPGRQQLTVREAAEEFLDARGEQQIKICNRQDFVGRRRIIQRCLTVLNSLEGDKNYFEGIVLHGMAGLGKSSLAARLCERMEKHKRLVCFGYVNEAIFVQKIIQLTENTDVLEIFDETRLNLTQRIRRLLKGPLLQEPVLFIFDDFEQNLDSGMEGTHVVQPEPLHVIKALLEAIRETRSNSRVIITSRHLFPFSGKGQLYKEGLESMRKADLTKKCRQLGELHKIEHTAEICQQIEDISTGNPRLLENLYDKLELEDAGTEDSLATLEKTVEEFRTKFSLEELLNSVGTDCRRLAAFMLVYNLPVEFQAVSAVSQHMGNVDKLLTLLESTGLIEVGKDYATGEARYYISKLLEPLLENEVTDEERMEAYREAAKCLYDVLFSKGKERNIENAKEIYRMAAFGQENHILVKISEYISDYLLYYDRYREVEELLVNLVEIEDNPVILRNLARVKLKLGKTDGAESYLRKALEISKQCSETDEELIVTAYNELYLANRLVVTGDIAEALDLYQDALKRFEQIGYVMGQSNTMYEMAGVIAQQGDTKQAMELWQKSLAMKEQIGDVQGQSATMHAMAGVIAQQGDVKQAMELWQKSLATKEQIGDVQGWSSTLSNMAGVISKQGNVKQAMELWQKSLAMKEQIGDVQGQAATLANMASAHKTLGEFDESIKLNIKSVKLLIQANAWLDAVTVLSNLGTTEECDDAIQYLIQAYWLALHVYVPIDDMLALANYLAEKIVEDHQVNVLNYLLRPHLIRERAEMHPEKDALLQYSQQLLDEITEQCRDENGDIDNEKLALLTNPDFLYTALIQELEKLVDDEKWLYDRNHFRKFTTESDTE